MKSQEWLEMSSTDTLHSARWVRVLFASLTGLAALSARAVPLGDGETATAGSSDYEITGNVTFGEGTYSGKITGTGTAIIETGSNAKYCVFTNPANTYSGGTIVSNASWKVTGTGATGTGKITIALTDSIFRPESSVMVVTNEIEVIQSSSTSHNAASVILPLWQKTTFTGDIRAHGNLAIEPTRLDTDYGKGGMTYYDCDVRCCAKDDGTTRCSFYPWGYGTNVFRKGLLCDAVVCGNNASECGWYEFHTTSNEINQIYVYNGRLSFLTNDVAPSAGVAFRYGGQSSGRAVINLCGHDQSFIYISDRNKNDAARDSNRKCFTSQTPARLTLTGSDTHYAYMKDVEWKLEGKVTFCLDVPASRKANYSMGFAYSEHATSGDLVVSNGTLNILYGAKMPSVGRIVVAEGGHLVVSNGVLGAFAGCTNLVVDGEVAFKYDSTAAFTQRALSIELGENAQLTLPTDAPLIVNSLSVGGETKAKGTYSATEIPQLRGGTINVIPPVADVDATWTGAGADDRVSTAENWSIYPKTPDLDSPCVLATFASGGAQATLGQDIALRGIVFGGLAGGVSSFAIAGAGRTLSVKSLGVTVAAADGDEHLWTIDPQVEYLDTAAQTFDVPAGHTLDLAGGVKEVNAFMNTKTGAGALKVGGPTYVAGSCQLLEGPVEFSGDVQIVSGIYVTNAALTVRGRVSSLGAGVPDTRGVVDGSRKNSPTHELLVDARKTADLQGSCSSIRLDGATFDLPVHLLCPGDSIAYPARTNWWQVAPGSTNAFNAYCYLSAPIGEFPFGPGSVTSFNSSLYVGGECNFSNPKPSDRATVNFANPNRTFCGTSGGGPCIWGGITANFSGTNNYLYARSGKNDYFYDLKVYGSQTTVNFLNDMFFHVGSIQTSGNTTIINLNGTRQMIWSYRGSSYGELTGTEGGELEISRFGYFDKTYRVTGAVSLRINGKNFTMDAYTETGKTALFTNFTAVASTGDVTVDCGTLWFAASGTWVNAGTVTVNGGRLELANNKAFGRKTKVVLTGGKVMLDYAAEERPLRVRELWVNSKRMPAGVYSAASVPAESGLTAADWFEGTGRLAVRGGFVVLLK